MENTSTQKDSIAILGMTYGSCLNIEKINYDINDSVDVYYSYYDSKNNLVQGESITCELYETEIDRFLVTVFDYQGDQYRLDDFLVTNSARW